MPFRSQAQRGYFHIAEAKGKLPAGITARWEKHTPKGKKLPKRVAKSAAAFLGLQLPANEDVSIEELLFKQALSVRLPHATAPHVPAPHIALRPHGGPLFGAPRLPHLEVPAPVRPSVVPDVPVSMPHVDPVLPTRLSTPMAPASPHVGPTVAPHVGPTAAPHAGPTAAPHAGPTAAPAGPVAAPAGPTAAPAGPVAVPAVPAALGPTAPGWARRTFDGVTGAVLSPGNLTGAVPGLGWTRHPLNVTARYLLDAGGLRAVGTGLVNDARRLWGGLRGTPSGVSGHGVFTRNGTAASGVTRAAGYGALGTIVPLAAEHLRGGEISPDSVRPQDTSFANRAYEGALGPLERLVGPRGLGLTGTTFTGDPYPENSPGPLDRIPRNFQDAGTVLGSVSGLWSPAMRRRIVGAGDVAGILGRATVRGIGTRSESGATSAEAGAVQSQTARELARHSISRLEEELAADPHGPRADARRALLERHRAAQPPVGGADPGSIADGGVVGGLVGAPAATPPATPPITTDSPHTPTVTPPGSPPATSVAPPAGGPAYPYGNFQEMASRNPWQTYGGAALTALPLLAMMFSGEDSPLRSLAPLMLGGGLLAGAHGLTGGDFSRLGDRQFWQNLWNSRPGGSHGAVSQDTTGRAPAPGGSPAAAPGTAPARTAAVPAAEINSALTTLRAAGGITPATLPQVTTLLQRMPRAQLQRLNDGVRTAGMPLMHGIVQRQIVNGFRESGVEIAPGEVDQLIQHWPQIAPTLGL